MEACQRPMSNIATVKINIQNGFCVPEGSCVKDRTLHREVISTVDFHTVLSPLMDENLLVLDEPKFYNHLKRQLTLYQTPGEKWAIMPDRFEWNRCMIQKTE